jgi:uncharacterized delta-60 repeat protein/uncharacterized repeat protein (TIGR02543 family)
VDNIGMRNATPTVRPSIVALLGLLIALVAPAAAQAAAGAVDTSWSNGSPNSCSSSAASNWCVPQVAVQPDGKLIVVGGATQWGGLPAIPPASNGNRVFRLNADGTRDASFPDVLINPGVTAYFGLSVAVNAVGKIFVGGVFTNVSIDGAAPVARGGILALNPDGTLDTTFNATTALSSASNVSAIVPTADGGVIIGGDFNTCGNGTACYLARLTSTGTLDTSFAGTTTAQSTDSRTTVIIPAPGGGYYVGGNFTSYKGVAARYVMRINDDGTRDLSFPGTRGPSDNVWALAVDTSDRLLIGGQFGGYWTTYNTGFTTAQHLVRVSATGVLDTAFSAVANWGPGGSDSFSRLTDNATAIAVDATGRILVGGSFDKFGNRSGGSVTNTTIGGFFALNDDGTGDAAYNAQIGVGGAASGALMTGAYGGIRTIVPSGSGVFVGGNFESFEGFARKWLVRLDSGLIGLTVATSGAGTGTVTSSPTGIDCGATCIAAFAPGASVTLTATPASDSTFTGWTGDCTGTATPCTITMSADKTTTATFAKKDAGGGTAAPTAAASGSDSSTTPKAKATATVTSATTSGANDAVITVRVSGAGIVGTTGLRTTTGGTGTPTITACRSLRTRVTKATTVKLTCHLNAATRALLRTRGVRVTFATTFTPTGGTAIVRKSVLTFRANLPTPEPVTG